MQKLIALAAVLFCSVPCSFAQNTNSAITQVLVGVDAQPTRVPAQSEITLKVNGKAQALTGWSQVPPDQLQIAVLIDNNNLQKVVGEQLDSLRVFATSLPARAQIYVGYVTDEGVQTEQQFTINHARAASRFRQPSGTSRASVSPFVRLSEFVKNWPLPSSQPGARVVLLLTTGIEYGTGYADKAAEDAQRAGVAVFAIYLNDRIPANRWGNKGGVHTSDSPIDYLDKVTGETGGRAYYEWTEQQPPLAVYLDKFSGALAGTHVASFNAPAVGDKMLRLKVETKLPGVKLTAPKATVPGNMEISPSN